MQTINTALCSFGMSGWVFHAPFIQAHPGFNFYAVFERSKDLARQQYPSVRVYRSLDEMLADDEVQLVIVNTPNATHFEFAKKALLAGKHVVVEKPFTTELHEAMELAGLAKKQGKVLSVYHNRRWDSDFLTVKKIVDENLLGRIVEVEIHFDRFKEELSPKLHKETPGPGAGAFYDLGSHLVDQAIVLFGMPKAVFADMAAMRPNSQVDDYFEVLLYYDDRRVRLKGSYVVKEPVPAYIVHGTKGSFLKTRADVQEASLQAMRSPGDHDWGIEPAEENGLLHTQLDRQTIKKNIISERGNYMHYYHQLHRAITGGEQPPVTPEEGCNVIRVITAAFMSHREKKVIQL